MKNAQELLEILTLKDLGNNDFDGTSKDIGSPNVFGGQVLAQSLNAAYRTVSESRFLHSLHSYFLEAGNLELPITYHVQRIRDGGSFSTRRVTASQNGKTIFILACSFHKVEKGYEHQMPIKKEIKQPEELLSWTDILDQFGAFLPKKLKAFLSIERPIEFKPTEVPNPLEVKNLPPVLDVWFKLKGATTNLSLPIKQQILTYLSDYNILTACLNPNASEANFGNTQMASLDHSMWFYRDFDFNDWMLFSIESPNSFGARGFACGNIYTRDGKLIASVAQEGLMRPMKK
ncbi:acyl-CoA thioesterase [Tenacibaculum maritimum]|uniref:acyl-CoA thioesterase n=1 Tax=Tenacibaculum maritimum TaxID=107401 RepID=UPI0012E3FF0E|nr:acyl-CoA thioesterase II [Tenacibaculum maritimum]MCD9562082.1 acyl-CoA thioesterase II [Tenacibaculum maritimum]MCD9566043.1 acyl-CoA thioesterase II [Tenacibaculum maritimum]MCD9578470.1 acyl-CoA thioesterase II [Tenacibaculum maritimum]MCD9596321.1 acyl-CoA thioesterase II [Tenacibaculum maritimum]MCD9612487.1 acyl-CoA thioesterase II [Tenacibaculum maritimum]